MNTTTAVIIVEGSLSVCLIELLLEVVWVLGGFLLGIDVDLFEVFVVEIIAHVFMIIDPGSDHVWVLLMEMNTGGLSVQKNRLIVSNVVSRKCCLVIDQLFSPQVWVRSALVHGSIGFEKSLNIELVLFQHHINLFLILGLQNLLEISSHSVLFFVESIEVWSSNGEDMLSQKLSQCTSMKYKSDSDYL